MEDTKHDDDLPGDEIEHANRKVAQICSANIKKTDSVKRGMIPQPPKHLLCLRFQAKPNAWLSLFVP